MLTRFDTAVALLQHIRASCTPSGDISSVAAVLGRTLPLVSARPPPLIELLQTQTWLQLLSISDGGHQRCARGRYSCVC